MTERDLGVVEMRVRHWAVNWSAIWVGALAAITVGLVIGLIGYALGAHDLASSRVVDWKKVRLLGMLFSIGGAFFSFVAGGWVAARINGDERAEGSMLHGAIAWLVAVPLMIGLAALGANIAYGSWYAALGGMPVWSAAAVPIDPATAAAFRNTALATAAALLLGLVGSVVGGWMASGEPMSLTYYRRRAISPRERARRIA